MSFGTMLIASTLFDTTLSVFSAKAKEKAYEAQEQQSISTALENRRLALFAGRAEVDKIRKKGRLLEGMDIAKTAGSGINMTGSALDVVMQNINATEKDADAAWYNANLKADAYMRQGLNDAARYANAEASLPLETGSHIAGTLFNAYAMNKQNTMANNQVKAYETNAKASLELTNELRNSKDELLYGKYYSENSL